MPFLRSIFQNHLIRCESLSLVCPYLAVTECILAFIAVAAVFIALSRNNDGGQAIFDFPPITVIHLGLSVKVDSKTKLHRRHFPKIQSCRFGHNII